LREVDSISLITWLKSLFGSSPVPLSGADLSVYAEEYAATVGDIYFREMAFWSATNLISNAVSKCEFKTFMDGKEIKEREYYLWNIEPNRNQNSSAFIHKWLSQLCRKNEVLIIDQNGQLLVADSFTRTPYALYDDLFTQVTIGDFTFNRPFSQSEVLYFKLSECDMRKVTDALYNSYSKLIEYSMKAYQRSRGTKVKFKYDTLPVAGTDERRIFDNLINEKIAKWLMGDNAALPLGRGQDVTELTQKTYSSESTRDIRAQIDDISDFTAKAFGIPPALLRGDVQGTKDAFDNFLTFCIDPLTDMLSEEINRKRNGYSGFSAGNYLKIDTKQIRHVDVLSVSTAVDKLIGSGAFCVNDIRELCGESIINEPWAYTHYITKNYMPFEEALAAQNGGEQ
jgi:HK97 family phage portal protein